MMIFLLKKIRALIRAPTFLLGIRDLPKVSRLLGIRVSALTFWKLGALKMKVFRVRFHCNCNFSIKV